MNDHQTKYRWNQLCDKIEALIREYGETIQDYDQDDLFMSDDENDRPDWQNPLAIADWVLILSVEDKKEDRDDRGYWTFQIAPPQQFPYRTRGLVEESLRDMT